jgi:phage terminase small subunit
MGENATLSPRQRRFVNAVLTARTIREAASKVKVAESTAWRWLALPGVKAALCEAQDAALAQSARAVAALLTNALDTLSDVMGDSGAPVGARVSAARTILENAVRLVDVVSLAERVAELEQRVGGESNERQDAT